MRARPSSLPLVLLVAVVGCGPSSAGRSPADVETADIVSRVDLIERLRAEGATVRPLGRIVTATFSVPGEALLVDGERVEAYRFATESEASAEVARVTTSAIHWMPPARLYQRDGLLIYHAADRGPVAELLEEIFGSPVASA